MKEKSRLLKNMSSSSRSSVNVRPRRVDPPSAITQGAKVRSDIGVLIALRIAVEHRQTGLFHKLQREGG